MTELNSLKQKDILRASQFSRHDIEVIMKKAGQMRDMVLRQGRSDELKGKLMTALFYEPSSRTFGSFIAAIQRLGGGFIPLQGVVYSSVAKGETLQDTVRTFASYSDVVVLRHPEVGSAEIAARVCDKPVINAGDGIGEHPTQALLDLFTVSDHFGSPDGKTVTLVGDLLNGRTVHSLVTLLMQYKPKAIRFVSPLELRLPQHFIIKLAELNIPAVQTDDLATTVSDTDVLYVTRVQKERFEDLRVYEKLKKYFVVAKPMVDSMNKHAIIMHPFPRVEELSADVDDDPRAAYLREQMVNGMYIRMALLSLILNNKQ